MVSPQALVGYRHLDSIAHRKRGKTWVNWRVLHRQNSVVNAEVPLLRFWLWWFLEDQAFPLSVQDSGLSAFPLSSH